MRKGVRESHLIVLLSDAIDDLLTRQTQDPGRLSVLADFCKEQFEAAGLVGVCDEVNIHEHGRTRKWDLAYVCAEKPRLLVSLKSIRGFTE
jgi:hypothetical protein